MEFSHEQIVKISLDNHAPWLLIALKDMEDGVKRAPEGKSNARILQYWKHTNYNPETDKESFCAAGACTWIEEAGYESPHDPAAISFESLPKLKIFKPGCFILFSRDGAEEWMRHITIGLAYDEHAGVYWCLGANQGGAVCIKPYSESRLDGFYWPKKELSK